jgi:hypothetical protein
MTKIETEMLEALAAYHGPVTKCPPGQARGADLPRKEDRTQRWLNGHRGDVPLRDEKAERRRKRVARAERERIAKRNASVRKRNDNADGYVSDKLPKVREVFANADQN